MLAKHVRITSNLITRKCNLKCYYCRISGNMNYPTKPSEYPSPDYYFKNQQDSDWWIGYFKHMKENNNECFHLLYGGEPLLEYKLLAEIVNYMNKEDIPYSIISNATEMASKNMDKFLELVGYVMGFTCSIDPVIMESVEHEGIDNAFKSLNGLKMLKKLIEQGLVKDPVAEITCDKKNIKYLYDTIKYLSSIGICSDITVVDIARNGYYDFSSVTDENELLTQNDVKEQFDKIMNDSSLLVHMKDVLLNLIYNVLPANMDCGIEKHFHNLTIDSDGAMRLCLRIRGVETPKFDAYSIFNDELDSAIMEAITKDKKNYCRNCNWTCMLMSGNDDITRIVEH